MRRLWLSSVLLISGLAWAGDVVDMAGRTVAVPDRIERVACLEVLCFQKMLMLGAADKVTEMTMTNAPWMVTVYPAVASIAKIPVEVNFEDLLAQRVDAVFYAYSAQKTGAKLASLGLAGLVSQPEAGNVATAEGYIGEYKRAVRMFAKVLGGDAVARAEEWCVWVDRRLQMVTSRVADIPSSRRTRVYYLRGPDALTTQGPGSATYWFSTLAGADMVIRDQSWQGKGPVSMEDMLRWNPDVILVGRHYSADLVLRDTRWAGISAVRSGRVYPTPEGVFYWDGGVESILLLEFVAKRLYPERFTDLDLAAELKDFYRRFYGYALSDSQAALLLDGRAPNGSRSNSMNN
ncbi:MAG TPA: ABC transporter substrate-binding protein [Candidatus Sulfotelmatobacter sp.]|jgi:iron complex transport system substrate-binding protein|nr:ABC transporter substrate-binding protein [Candidatus Sulfotelmatobacter sp.]